MAVNAVAAHAEICALTRCGTLIGSSVSGLKSALRLRRLDTMSFSIRQKKRCISFAMDIGISPSVIPVASCKFRWPIGG